MGLSTGCISTRNQTTGDPGRGGSPLWPGSSEGTLALSIGTSGAAYLFSRMTLSAEDELHRIVHGFGLIVDFGAWLDADVWRK